MGNSVANGFFSYAHFNNKDGRLSQIRNDLCEEYEALTGDRLELFFDDTSLEWGKNWRANIEAGIDSAAFFIPILTPHYYLSENCQEELQQFLIKVEELGEPGLILPINYIPLPDDMRSSMKALVDKVEKYQWKRFDDLRFVSFASESYLRAINEMASHIVEVNNRLVGRVSIGDQDAKLSGDLGKSEHESGGQTFYLESLDIFTDGIPELGTIIQQQVEIQTQISSTIQDGTAKMLSCSERPRSVKDALAITAQVATRLRPLAKDYEQGSHRFAEKVNQLDPHVRRIVSIWREHDEDEAALSALGSIQNQVEATKGAKGAIDRYVEVLKSTATLSRVLHEPIKQIERSASLFSGACALVISWEDLLD